MMGHLILGRSHSEHHADASVRTRWIARMVQIIFRRRN